MSLFLIMMNPQWRKVWSERLGFMDPKILATLDLTLGTSKPKSQQFLIMKVKDRQGLYLDIYQKRATEYDAASQKLTSSNSIQVEVEWIQKIQLKNSMDGYINFKDHPSNLAMADLDRDSVSEILVPSFDDRGVGTIDIFKWNLKSNRFERQSPTHLIANLISIPEGLSEDKMLNESVLPHIEVESLPEVTE